MSKATTKQPFAMLRTTGETIEGWEPSAELRARLLGAMATQFIEWEQAGVLKHFVRCKRCKLEAKKVCFLAPSAEAVLGPHCSGCHKLVVEAYERDSGALASLPVYVISGNAKVLHPLRDELRERARTVSEVDLHVTVPDEELF